MATHDLACAQWRKSSRSHAGDDCVEVAPIVGAVAVRDSKNAQGPALVFSVHEWREFTAGLKMPGA